MAVGENTQRRRAVCRYKTLNKQHRRATPTAAKKGATIRTQFLWESILISLLGAFFGIVLGISVGNLAAVFLKTGFIVPWLWVIAGVLICFITGLLAGLCPAMKASKLDPITALRYE